MHPAEWLSGFNEMICNHKHCTAVVSGTEGRGARMHTPAEMEGRRQKRGIGGSENGSKAGMT